MRHGTAQPFLSQPRLGHTAKEAAESKWLCALCWTRKSRTGEAEQEERPTAFAVASDDVVIILPRNSSPALLSSLDDPDYRANHNGGIDRDSLFLATFSSEVHFA